MSRFGKWESYVDLLLPWDFKITDAGVEHAMRPLTVGDLASIEAVLNGKVASMEAVLELAAGLFVEPAPNLRAWKYERVILTLSDAVDYLTEQTKKNTAAIFQAAKAAKQKAKSESSNL